MFQYVSWRCQQCSCQYSNFLSSSSGIFVTCSIPEWPRWPSLVHMTKTHGRGPLNIGGRGLMDFENSALMYGRNFKKISLQNVSDCSSSWAAKSQNLFGDLVHQASKKNQNLFGQGHTAPKTALFSFGLAIRPQKRFAFPPNDNQIANVRRLKFTRHPYRPYYPPRPNTYMPSKIYINICHSIHTVK